MKDADIINSIAEQLRIESGSNLPRDYFLAQARLQLSRKQAPHGTKDEKYHSSACFDAWAKPEHGRLSN
ncbi:hypothetical protein [Rhizobium subbaraonis]|nr:hypothetical protein [Rhizobium subbaraonis]